ncbi:unnamed protein product [Rhizophagus irregularis]|nr:unnamed protein product [Rhizophagus irregularis]CAB5386035.1 unnamed protein product [Rhizophagus irregularis]
MVINIDLDVSFSVPFSHSSVFQLLPEWALTLYGETESFRINGMFDGGQHALLVHLYYGTNKKGNNHYYIKEWISLEAVYVTLLSFKIIRKASSFQLVLMITISPDGDISLVERVGKGKIADTRVKLYIKLKFNSFT